MKFEMIDYSDDYYGAEPIPAYRKGKFVQIRNKNNGQEFIVLSPREYLTFHADIVEQFCLSKKIEGRQNRSTHHFYIYSTSWEVTGGGYWAINSIEKTFDLSGKSGAYGRFDSHGIEANIVALKHLNGYTVTIDNPSMTNDFLL